MIKSLKALKTEMDLRRCKQHLKTDEEGRVLIDLRVRNDDDFLSPYGMGKNSVLSEEASGFIEHSVKNLPAETSLHFRIHSDVITKREQKKYAEALREHYADSYERAEQEKRRFYRIAWIMAMVAVVALSVMIGMEISGVRSAVLVEIIDIFAWVFMWEAVDITFLECTVLRMKQKRYLRLSDSVIEYLPLSNSVKTEEKE